MELTLIAFLDSKHKDLEHIEEILEIQKDEKFEFILIADSLSQKILKELLDVENKFKSNEFKIIFNYRKQGEVEGIVDAIKISTKKYTLIHPNILSFKKTFITEINKITNLDRNIDIVEFRPNIKGIVDWKPELRTNLKLETIFDIESNTEILAYSYPFIFNKIFRTEILQSAFETKNYSNTTSSFELFYYIFPFAKSYMSIDRSLSRETIDLNHFSSYTSSFNDWKKLENFYSSAYKNLIQELIYAKFFYLQVIVPGFLGIINRKKRYNIKYNFSDKAKMQLSKNYFNKLKSIYESEFKNLAINSKYMMKKNSDIQFLEKVTPISKWGKILKNFE